MSQNWVIGMYVYQSSTATFRTEEEIRFSAFPGDVKPIVGAPKEGVMSVDLPKGIYRFDPPMMAPLDVAADNADVITAKDKDPPPDPTATARFRTAFETTISGMTYDRLKKFFNPIARSD